MRRRKTLGEESGHLGSERPRNLPGVECSLYFLFQFPIGREGSSLRIFPALTFFVEGFEKVSTKIEENKDSKCT